MQRFKLLCWVLLMSGFSALYAQAISGTITDTSGEPLIGASVLVAGTTTGTVTDIDGTFQLNLPASAEKLIVTYTGFETQEILLNGQTTLDIVLKDNSTVLDEVVVTGYGTQTRRRLTTSIASVGTEAFDNVPVTSFENALQGRLPGVTINANSGTLGAQTSIRVRGIGSINSDNQPLFVVDGVIINSNQESNSALGGPGTNPLVNINPADIQSIDVLKDAASAAIYGSRGANGVVIITTKSGSFNRPATVSVNHQTGFTDPTEQYDLLTGPQYAELWNRAFVAGGGDPNSAQIYANPAEQPDAQWLDRVTRTGVLNETNASVSGGTENLAYFVGGTYRDEDGWIDRTNLKRYSLRLNLEQKLGDKWRVGLNLNPTRTVNLRQNEDNNVASPQTYAALAFPNLDPFDDNGNVRGGILRTSTGRAQFAGSPLINIQDQDISLTTNQVIAKAFTTYEPIAGLRLTTSFGTQYLTLQDAGKSGSLTTDGFGSGGTGSAAFTEVLNYTWDNTANYLLSLGRSELDLTAGFNVQYEEVNALSVFGNSFADDRLLTLNSAAEITGGGGSNTEFRFVGYFLRAIYSLDDKLFINGSIRLDGSSRFGSDNYYGIFPAISAAYDFARGSDGPFSALKLRASYGQTGNAGIGNFASRGLVGFGNDYNMIPGFLLAQLENTELTWETAETIDAAIDFETANGFLQGSIGYFIKTNTDLLLDVPQPQTNGINSLTLNAGEIRNQGLEFLLDFNLIRRPDFTWTFSLNGATLDNEVLKLIDNNGDGVADDVNSGQQLIREGEAIGTWYLQEYAGVDPDNGNALFRNGEGEVSSVFPGGDDRILAGNPLPDFTGGFGSRLKYKDLDFQFQFQAAMGHQLYLSESRFVENNLGATWNQRTTQLDAWTPDNRITNVPEARLRNNGGQHSTRYLSDADYLRLRFVQLGYTFRNLGRTGNSLRVFVGGNNLLTFTDFAGLDPEASGQDVNGWQQGSIFFSRPQTRVVNFGVNLTL